MNKRIPIFSSDRKYRYVLWREWNALNKEYVMFVGLNPSTADEVKDDLTLRRCIGFAKQWGFGSLCMTNLFAYRTRDPIKMKNCPHPIGDENNKWLIKCADGASIVIAAWGVHGQFMNRDRDVLKLLNNVMCLGLTKYGIPKHPLYLPQDVKPFILKGGIR